MTNFASRAAAFLRSQQQREAHRQSMLDQYRTELNTDDEDVFLEGVALAAKFPRKTFVEHPDRPRQWVRPGLISDRDRNPSAPPPGNQHGPGRSLSQGDAA